MIISLRQVLKNTAVSLGGGVGSAVLNFGALTITATALGPALFGILAMIQSYYRLVDSVANLRSDQMVVKYLSDSLADSDETKKDTVIFFGFILDFITAFFGTLVALILGFVLIYLVPGIGETGVLFFVYALFIATQMTGTSQALMRLESRFVLLGVLTLIPAALRLGGVVWLAGSEAGFDSFLILWLIGDILLHVLLICGGLLTAKKLKVSWTGFGNIKEMASDRRILGFIFNTNAMWALRQVAQEGDTILVGALTSSAGAGVYQVAKRFAGIIMRFAEPVIAPLYPALARAWSSANYLHFKQLLTRANMISGALASIITITFVLVGETVLLVLFNEEYLKSFNLIIVHLLVATIYFSGISFSSSLMCMEQARYSLFVTVIGTAVFVVVAPVLLIWLGPIGVSFAHLLFTVIWYSMVKLRITSQLARVGCH